MNNLKKSFSFLLGFAVLISNLAIVSLPAGAAKGDSPDDPIIIENAAGLAAIATGLDKHYKVVKDITGARIGSNSTPETTAGFSGSLVGDKGGGEKPVITLTINSTLQGQGLFSIIEGGTVDNLAIEANISGGRDVGAVVGFMKGGVIKNVEVTGTISSSSQRVGGIAGYVSKGTISGCVNHANISSSINNNHAHMGGIVGICIASTSTGVPNGPITIENCKNYGNITSTSIPVTATTGNVGGIVGSIWSDTAIDGSIVKGCFNAGDIKSTGQQTGGIVGSMTNKTAVIELCGNIGDVTSTNTAGGRASGIVAADKGIVRKCFNSGTITGYKYVTGIFAYLGTADSTIENCFNAGKIHATNTVSGDTITANSNAAGIVYTTSGSAGVNYTAKWNYNAGAVTSASGKDFSATIGTDKLNNASNNYYLDSLEAGTTHASEPLSAAVMKDLSEFLGLGFDSGVWTLDSSNTSGKPYKYPTLIGNPFNIKFLSTPLDTPVDFKVSDGPPYILTFKGDENALGYEAKIKYWEKETTLTSGGTEPSIDISSALKVNVPYTITVKSVGDGKDYLASNESAPYTYHYSGGVDNEIQITKAQIKYRDFVIEGKATAEEAFDLKLTVGKPDVALENISGSNVLYKKEFSANSDGEFSLTFSVGENTGTFGYIITSDDPVLEKTGTAVYMPESNNKISSFSLGEYAGTINGETIRVSVPSSASLSGLIAKFTVHAEARVQVNGVAQVSGTTRNNFNSPVVYEVTAENGAVKTYTVTVETYNSGSGGGGGGRIVAGGGTQLVLPDAVYPNPVSPVKKESFTDIPQSYWAYQYIEALAEKNIISGYPEGSFRPENFVTREEFVKMVVAAFGFDGEQALSFSDISGDAWYYGYVSAAVNSGIIKGISDKDFGAGRFITREDMAVIIVRAAQAKNKSVNAAGKKTFTDAGDIADYAADAVAALADAGLINGYENGAFLPKNNAVRAEVAYILYRFL